jgi:hypothetical protein
VEIRPLFAGLFQLMTLSVVGSDLALSLAAIWPVCRGSPSRSRWYPRVLRMPQFTNINGAFCQPARDDCGTAFTELQVPHRDFEAAVAEQQTKCGADSDGAKLDQVSFAATLQ